MIYIDIFIPNVLSKEFMLIYFSKAQEHIFTVTVFILYLVLKKVQKKFNEVRHYSLCNSKDILCATISNLNPIIFYSDVPRSISYRYTGMGAKILARKKVNFIYTDILYHRLFFFLLSLSKVYFQKKTLSVRSKPS